MNRITSRHVSLLISLCCSVALLYPLTAKAQSNQPIYTGSVNALAGAWQNWSWCSTNFGATNYVYPGDTYSAQITYTAGYQGFYVESPGVNTILYTNLTFWINGGSAGGQQIAVYGLANNVQGNPVSLSNYLAAGSVSAGEWQQVTIPLADLGIANTANVDGFWLTEPTGSAQPAFYLDNITLTAAPIPSSVNLAVNAGNKVRTLDSRIFGINTAVWDSELNTPGTLSLLSAANTQILRFPGGSTADSYNWQTNLTVGDSNPWASNFDAFAAVVTGLKAQAFVTANYGSGTAQEAAAWVAYSNVTNGYGLKYWEIGNEVYGSWEYDTHTIPNDPYTYAVQVQAYIAAMKAVDPTIKIGVVAITGEDSYANNTNHPATNPVTGVVHNGWTPVMLATLKSLGVVPDFLIYHRYEQNPGSESDEGLLQAAQTWPNDAQNLRMMLNDYLGTPTAAGVELVCTENNSVSYDPGKQSTSLINGLYLADSVGCLLQTEFNAMAWWDLRNGQQTGNNNSTSLYGWREYGDYGVLDPNNAGYPTYYAMKLLSNLGVGGDSVVATTSNYPLLSSYSVLRQNGSLSVLVINKSATNSLTGSLNLSNFSPSSTATVYSYGIPQDSAAQTGSGSTDILQTSLSNVSANFSYSFQPYSLTIISLSPAAAVVPTALSLSPSIVTGGVGSTGTVTLSGAAPSGGLFVSLSSTSGATVPTSVTVAAGSTTATFTANTSAVSTSTTATITASANGTSASATLTVNAAGLVPTNVTFSPSSVTGGASSTGTVTITTVAPKGGLVVSLSSASGATVPGSVTVAAGKTSVTFTAKTIAVAANTTATVTASANGASASGGLTVNAPVPSLLGCSPTSIAPGGTTAGKLTISSVAPTGGLTVALSSSGSVAIPGSVTVPAGSTTVAFTVTGVPTSTSAAATITATANGKAVSATVTVNAPAPTSIALSPATVTGGATSTGTVNISGPAPTGGLAVALSSTGSASVPSTVTVPAGAKTATFTVSTSAVTAKSTSTISAAYNGVTKSATLTINTAALLSLTFNPANVVGGTKATLTVTLSGPAPLGGATVTLTSNKPADVTLPAVTVPAGSSSVTVTVNTAAVKSSTTVAVTGSYNATTKTANLTLAP